MTLWPTPSTALSATALSTLLDAPPTASAEVLLACHALHGWAANRGQAGSSKTKPCAALLTLHTPLVRPLSRRRRRRWGRQRDRLLLLRCGRRQRPPHVLGYAKWRLRFCPRRHRGGAEDVTDAATLCPPLRFLLLGNVVKRSTANRHVDHKRFHSGAGQEQRRDDAAEGAAQQHRIGGVHEHGGHRRQRAGQRWGTGGERGKETAAPRAARRARVAVGEEAGYCLCTWTVTLGQQTHTRTAAASPVGCDGDGIKRASG